MAFESNSTVTWSLTTFTLNSSRYKPLNHNLLLLVSTFTPCLEISLKVSNDLPQFNDHRPVRLYFAVQA